MPLSASESTWLQALKKSEPSACRRLVETYLPSLHTFFRGMGLPLSSVDDLIQETFLEFWRSLPNFRGDASLKTWVFLLGRRLAWKQIYRTRRVEEPLPSDEEGSDAEIALEEKDQEEGLWVRQRNEVLRACIDELPPLYREILSLHYMEEMAFSELSRILDIPEGTVKSRLSKALGLLRQSVRRRFLQGESEIPTIPTLERKRSNG